VVFIGYPGRLEKNDFITDEVDCQVGRKVVDGRIKIIPDNPQFTFDKNAKEILEGYSGGGVFKETGQDILLVGIVSRLFDKAGAEGKILIMPIKYFAEIFTQEEIDALKSKFPVSFKVYTNKIWSKKKIPEHLSEILEKEAKKIIGHGISPSLVLKLFEGELFIKDDPGCKNDFELWSGWLEFLVYCNLITQESPPAKEEKLKSLLAGKRFVYSGTENHWATIITVLLKEHQHISKGEDTIIINSKEPMHKRKLKPADVRNILPNIGEDYWDGGGENDIGRVSSPHEDITFIHISEFAERINQNVNLTERLARKESEIIQELKNSVSEALNE
jgi:hypothetical protein